LRIRSMLATEVPPNFMTRRAIDPERLSWLPCTGQSSAARGALAVSRLR
jgi:hypothetical protein